MQNQSLTGQAVAGKRSSMGCFLAVALSVLAIGLFALYTGIRQYGKQPNALAPIIFGAIFTIVGLGLILGARYGASRSAKLDEMKTRYPDQPWMWREDWSRGVIGDSNKAGTFGLWIFAVVWNAISFPIAWIATRHGDSEERLAYLILLFPLAGVFVLIGAIYQTLRSMKFGTSQCHLERVPIVPGRAFRGHIDLNTQAEAPGGYRVRISSLRYVTTGRGKHRSTTEHQLWDAEILVPQGAAMRSPSGTRIPFQLAAPPDAHVTDENNLNDRYVWRIAVTADLPGVDYFAQFDVPVFHTGETNDGSEFAAFEQRHRSEAARHEVAPASGVRIARLPGGGEEFHIEAKKTFGSVTQSLLFLLAWNAAIAAMIYFHTPWGLPAFFIAIDLLLLVGTVNFFFGKTTIRVDTAGVRVHKKIFGPGSTTTYEADSIASIDGTAPAQNSKTFGVTLKLTDGRTRTLSSQLPDRASADIVAAKMLADLRRSSV